VGVDSSTPRASTSTIVTSVSASSKLAISASVTTPASVGVIPSPLFVDTPTPKKEAALVAKAVGSEKKSEKKGGAVGKDTELAGDGCLWGCYYCPAQSRDRNEIISHLKKEHATEKLVVTRRRINVTPLVVQQPTLHVSGSDKIASVETATTSDVAMDCLDQLETSLSLGGGKSRRKQDIPRRIGDEACMSKEGVDEDDAAASSKASDTREEESATPEVILDELTGEMVQKVGAAERNSVPGPLVSVSEPLFLVPESLLLVPEPVAEDVKKSGRRSGKKRPASKRSSKSDQHEPIVILTSSVEPPPKKQKKKLQNEDETIVDDKPVELETTETSSVLAKPVVKERRSLRKAPANQNRSLLSESENLEKANLGIKKLSKSFVDKANNAREMPSGTVEEDAPSAKTVTIEKKNRSASKRGSTAVSLQVGDEVNGNGVIATTSAVDDNLSPVSSGNAASIDRPFSKLSPTTTSPEQATLVVLGEKSKPRKSASVSALNDKKTKQQQRRSRQKCVPGPRAVRGPSESKIDIVYVIHGSKEGSEGDRRPWACPYCPFKCGKSAVTVAHVSIKHETRPLRVYCRSGAVASNEESSVICVVGSFDSLTDKRITKGSVSMQ